MTYGTLISSVTVGAGGAASIDLTSIPGTYTDLVLVYSIRDSSTPGTAQGTLKVTFNGSATSYSGKMLYGNGSAAASANSGTTYFDITHDNSGSSTASTFSNCIITIPNYAGSTNKSVSIDTAIEANATNALGVIGAGLWSNTSAITQITLTPASGTISQYSTAYLYGLLKGSGGASVS